MNVVSGDSEGAAVRQNAQCDAIRSGLLTAVSALNAECFEFTPNSSADNTYEVVNRKIGNPRFRALTENSMSAT